MKNTKRMLLRGLTVILFVCSWSTVCLAQKDGEDIAIGKYRVIHSEILNEDRTLLVHLPRGYADAKQHFPVIYMLYGDHVSTYFAEAVSILDTLGPTGRTPDFILVGIMNTDRYRDLLPLAPDGKPTGIANFTRFLQEELFPFIDGNYRTQEYRILVGPQAGGNFGFYSLFENPDLFAAYVLNNPFRWQGGRDVMMQKAEAFLKRNSAFRKFLFITYDDADPLAREGIGYIERFSELTKAKNPDGFCLALNFIGKQDEFLQPLGLREGLKRLFAPYPFPEDRKVERLDDILGFYRELSGKYGFALDPPEHVLTVQGDGLLQRGKVNEVVAILTYTMEKYPRAANSYFRMANILMRRGDMEGARDYLRKTAERIPHDSGMIRSRLAGLEKRITGSAAYQVEKAIQSSGIAAGIRKFRELKAAPQSGFYFSEEEFNELGYRLMQDGYLTGAIEIFKLNVESFPDSANAYDSLGESYMKNGDQEKARENYKKSLELNPGNQNAKEMLEKLKELPQGS